MCEAALDNPKIGRRRGLLGDGWFGRPLSCGALVMVQRTPTPPFTLGRRFDVMRTFTTFVKASRRSRL